MIRQRPLKEKRYHYFCERSAPSLHHRRRPPPQLTRCVIRPHPRSFSLCLIPPPSSILPPISSLLSLYFPPIASGSHAAVVCFLHRYMWGGDKPPQWAGLSDSRLDAPSSLFHAAWQRCRGHFKPRATKKKVCFLRTCKSTLQKHRRRMCKQAKHIKRNYNHHITNRLSGVAVNKKMDKWRFAGSDQQKGNNHQLKRKNKKVHYVCKQLRLLEMMFIVC